MTGQMMGAASWDATNEAITELSEIPSVVLLDDDPDYRDLFLIHARRAGLNARAVSNARDFVEGFDQEPALVCLIDLNMDDPYGVTWRFAGVSTLMEFRRRYGDQSELWVLTGMRNPGLMSTCTRAGATGVLTKNLGLEAIVERVKQQAEMAIVRSVFAQPPTDRSESGPAGYDA